MREAACAITKTGKVAGPYITAWDCFPRPCPKCGVVASLVTHRCHEQGEPPFQAFCRSCGQRFASYSNRAKICPDCSHLPEGYWRCEVCAALHRKRRGRPRRICRGCSKCKVCRAPLKLSRQKYCSKRCELVWQHKHDPAMRRRTRKNIGQPIRRDPWFPIVIRQRGYYALNGGDEVFIYYADSTYAVGRIVYPQRAIILIWDIAGVCVTAPIGSMRVGRFLRGPLD